MNIIFDYNRTLFDPETDALYPGVDAVLKNLAMKNDLFLISRNEPNRKDRFEKLGIGKYFKKILFVEKKTKEIFKSLIQNLEDTIIIGDRVREEISLGNQLGFITIWIKQGKFSGELPEKSKQPNYTINDIRELQTIISQYEK